MAAWKELENLEFVVWSFSHVQFHHTVFITSNYLAAKCVFVYVRYLLYAQLIGVDVQLAIGQNDDDGGWRWSLCIHLIGHLMSENTVIEEFG